MKRCRDDNGDDHARGGLEFVKATAPFLPEPGSDEEVGEGRGATYQVDPPRGLHLPPGQVLGDREGQRLAGYFLHHEASWFV